jgi:hypothetical protein
MVDHKPDESGKPAAKAGEESTRKGSGYRPWNGGRRAFKKPIIQQTKFEGKCVELKGYIYDCSDSKQADIFTKTTREVAEYVGRTYKYGSDVRLAVEKLQRQTITLPSDPPETASRTETKVWELEVTEYVRRKSYLDENLKTLYSLVWGQCTDIIRARIEALDEHDNMSNDGDSIALLKAIKALVYNFESQKYRPLAIHDGMRRFYLIHQDKHTTCQSYLEKFQNCVDVLDHCGGSLGHLPALASALLESNGIAPDNATAEQAAEAIKNTQDQYLAIAFLLGSDRARYGKLIENLENDHTQGQDRYPKTLTSAYSLLTNWKQDATNHMRFLGPSNDGITFVNTDGNNTTNNEHALNNNGARKSKQDWLKDRVNITCHKCQQKGHYANECTNERKEPAATLVTAGIVAAPAAAATVDDFEEPDHVHFQFLLNGTISDPRSVTTLKAIDRAITDHRSVVLNQPAGAVPKEWILLDNQSTVDVFYNKDLLDNVRRSDTCMEIHCNAGVTSTDLIGDLPGYGPVWYHPNGIANILSLARVKEKHRVTFDSAGKNKFMVHKEDGTTRCFKQSQRGLYYLETGATSVALVHTVAENKSKYTNRDYSRATLARRIQNVIGRPSLRTYLHIIEHDLIPNCPITRADVLAAEDIFGPNLGSLKGKTTRITNARTRAEHINIPITIMGRYRNVTIACDIMFVNQIPFFITISRHIKFGTVEMIKSRSAATLIAAVKQVRSAYVKRGFKVTHMLVDGEFETLRGDAAALGISLNVASRDEHVPEIERFIRTVKERTRCIYNTLKFKRMPPRIIIEMVYHSVFWLNMFPATDGISKTMSPRSIIAGLKLDYHKHCQLEFGTYVQVHEEHDNSMATRTTGAIALRPTGNDQGGYYFFSLATGRRLNRNRWTALPMPADVIDRVHLLARAGNALAGMAFTDRNGQVIDDDDDADDVSYDPDDDSAHNDDDDDHLLHDDDHVIAGVYDETINQNEDIDEPGNPDEPDNFALDEEAIEIENENENEDENENEEEIEIVNEDPTINNNQETDHPTIQDMEDQYGARSDQHNLRPRRPRDYRHLHHILESTVLTQHSVKKGLKKFGDAGVNAVLKELQQLHDRQVLDPKGPEEITIQERKDALRYLMFLKEKRCGTIKGRGCADGRKQREYTSKDETSSPTVAIESVMLSCTIDAKEGRDVATADIPGAFMQTDMDGTVHMMLEGKMAELLVKIDPKLYRKYLMTKNGKPIMYVQLKKALYGTLQAALLFWKDLSKKLVAWGFKINPYDWCVANKTIQGKQCTILWHVDDIKVSHVESSVVDNMLELFKAEYGKEAPLTITRGKVHEYLGMTIDYSVVGKVQITMIPYIQNMLSEIPNDMAGESATPAASHLFQVDEDADKLDETTAQLFHHYVAKLLFLCKRARPDIQTAIAFLCTRVKEPDTDDYKKLTRTMRYLRGTVDMPLTLEANNMSIVKWWVDAAYAVHPDMKSHTGGLMSLGKGAIYGASTKQKLNTKSSTEAELVGVNDVMCQILWTRYFLEAQGYAVTDSIINQDNQSAMLLEKNGRGSSSKRTRHINIRYFFVADRVAAGEVKIQYCPTEEMLADFFTKPLQGSIFRRFRNFILNIQGDLASPTSQDHRSVLRKRYNSKLSPTRNNTPASQLSDSGPLKPMTISRDKITGSAANAILSY